jgi:hypothetical protein
VQCFVKTRLARIKSVCNYMAPQMDSLMPKKYRIVRNESNEEDYDQSSFYGANHQNRPNSVILSGDCADVLVGKGSGKLRHVVQESNICQLLDMAYSIPDEACRAQATGPAESNYKVHVGVIDARVDNNYLVRCKGQAGD